MKARATLTHEAAPLDKKNNARVRSRELLRTYDVLMGMRTRAIFAGISALALLACSIDRAAPIAIPTVESPPATPTVAPSLAQSAPLIDAGAVSATAPIASDEHPIIEEDPNPPSGVVPPGVDADDVREAIFRHMFGSNASGQGTSAGVYCIEVEGQADPTSGFLARLKDVRPTVKGASHCSASAEDGVLDQSTHARGLEFRVETLTFKDAHHATATGGYYEAGLSASGNVYTLELRKKKWVVTKDQMMWIS
jgi:hypothetical protein